jgi:hypothetical protein
MASSLAEHIQFSLPFPSTTVHVPAVYYQMAADPTPGLVLSLPIYPRGSDEYYQTIHHRGLVGGYDNRVSLPMIRSIENVPYLSFLDPNDGPIATDPRAPELIALGDIYPLAVTFKQGLEERGVRYVVFTQPVAPTNPAYPTLDPQYPLDVKPWMRAFLLQQLGTPVYDDSTEGVTAWRLDPAPPAPGLVRFSMGMGWLPGLSATSDGHLVRYVEQDGQLLIDAPQAGPLDLTVTAFAEGAPRTMLVSLNGRAVLTHRFAGARQPETLDLGMLQLTAGNNTLQLHSLGGCPAYSQTDPQYSDLRCFAIVQVQPKVAAQVAPR